METETHTLKDQSREDIIKLYSKWAEEMIDAVASAHKDIVSEEGCSHRGFSLLIRKVMANAVNMIATLPYVKAQSPAHEAWLDKLSFAGITELHLMMNEVYATLLNNRGFYDPMAIAKREVDIMLENPDLCKEIYENSLANIERMNKDNDAYERRTKFAIVDGDIPMDDDSDEEE